MKTIREIIVGLILIFAVSVEAQISVQVNVGNPPQWGPSGYTNVRYYYLPDVEAYYDVPSSMFIYFNGVNWIHRKSLPVRHKNYDLYKGYKVVMTDYRGNTPYVHFKEYKSKYAKGYRGKPQKNYGEKSELKSSNKKEYVKKHDNPKYNKVRGGNEKKGKSKDKKSNTARGKDKKK